MPMYCSMTGPEMTTAIDSLKPRRAKNAFAASRSLTTIVIWSKCLTKFASLPAAISSAPACYSYIQSAEVARGLSARRRSGRGAGGLARPRPRRQRFQAPAQIEPPPGALGLHEQGPDLRIGFAEGGLDPLDGRFDLGGRGLVPELGAERGDHMVRGQMNGEHAVGALQRRILLRDLQDGGLERRRGRLADEQALGLPPDEDRRRGQHQPDADRRQAVELGFAGLLGREDAEEGDGDAQERGAVLEENGEGGRILAAADGLKIAE